MSRIMSVATILCAWALAAAVDGQSRPADIRRVARAIPDHYIVVLQSDVDADTVSREAAAPHQGRLRHVYRQALRGFSIELNAAAAAALARDPRVLFVEE